MSLRTLLSAEGDGAGAVRELEKILDQDPANPYAIYKIARVEIESNDLAGARKRLAGLRREGRRIFDADLAWAVLLALEGKASDESKKPPVKY